MKEHEQEESLTKRIAELEEQAIILSHKATQYDDVVKALYVCDLGQYRSDTVESVLKAVRDQGPSKNWKEIALWLADVQAATASDLLFRKSTSKSEKSRQKSICQKTLDVIRHQTPINIRSRSAEDVLDRLQQTLKDYE